MFSILTAQPPLYIVVSLVPLCMLLALVAHTWQKELSRHEKLMTLVLFLLCSAALWPDPSHALNLYNSPDAPEYAAGAFRMLTMGSYDIQLHGNSYPPRYPIGFSLFILLPSLLLPFSSGPGSSVLSVALITAMGAPCAYLIATRTHSETAGFLAVVLYLLLPGLWPSSQEILSFAPSAALWLLTVALVVVSVTPRGLSTMSCLAIGTSAMYAVACRPFSAFIIVPIAAFILFRDRAPQRVFALLTPITLLVALYVTYNTLVFHAPFRSGYHFWCGIPYDIPSLTFNGTYLWSNLSAFWDSGVPLLTILALAGYRAFSTERSKLLTVALILSTAAMLSFAHLFYFHSWALFFLPAAAILTPLASCSLASLLDKANIRLSRMAMLLLLLGTTLISRTAIHTKSYHPSPHAEFLLNASPSLPDNAVFISGMNPVFISLLIGKPQLLVLPISRQVEYANKVITPGKLPPLSSPPRSPYDHRSAFLPSDTFQEVFKDIPTEHPEMVRSFLAEGRAVFIDTRYSSSDDVEKLQQHLSLTEVMSGVSRASLRTPSD